MNKILRVQFTSKRFYKARVNVKSFRTSTMYRQTAELNFPIVLWLAAKIPSGQNVSKKTKKNSNHYQEAVFSCRVDGGSIRH